MKTIRGRVQFREARNGQLVGEEAGAGDGVGEKQASHAGRERRVVRSQYILQKVWKGPCLNQSCLQRFWPVLPGGFQKHFLVCVTWAESLLDGAASRTLWALVRFCIVIREQWEATRGF